MQTDGHAESVQQIHGNVPLSTNNCLYQDLQ